MASVKANLLAAFRYLLKPLVRLAVTNGVSFPEFCESLKQAYVDVAVAQMKTAGMEPTEEGVALVTSVPIMDVHGIAQSDTGMQFSSAVADELPIPTLLTAWHTDVRFTGPYGVTRDLKFPSGGTVGADNFSNLVSAYCPSFNASLVLDELLRLGCVVPVGSDYYRVVKRSYVPEPLSAPSILLFARVVHNLCEAAELNLRAQSVGGKGLVQRIIFTRYGLFTRDLAEFDKFIRSRGQIFADDVDNWLSDRDSEEGDGRINTGVGFYHYIVNDEDEFALSKKLPN